MKTFADKLVSLKKKKPGDVNINGLKYLFSRHVRHYSAATCIETPYYKTTRDLFAV